MYRTKCQNARQRHQVYLAPYPGLSPVKLSVKVRKVQIGTVSYYSKLGFFPKFYRIIYLTSKWYSELTSLKSLRYRRIKRYEGRLL